MGGLTYKDAFLEVVEGECVLGEEVVDVVNEGLLLLRLLPLVHRLHPAAHHLHGGVEGGSARHQGRPLK